MPAAKPAVRGPGMATLIFRTTRGAGKSLVPAPSLSRRSIALRRSSRTIEIRKITAAFVHATRRAREAGFQWLELHGAHGYLLHSFLSPLSNRRQDEYGGAFENRTRFMLETIRAMQKEWPGDKPFTVRLSCTDWMDGGWTLEDSVALSRALKAEGVDLIDCSSGGNSPLAKIPVGAGYQIPLSETIRREARIPTAAVGLVTAPMQADEIIRNDRADIVMLARELLRNPYWPLEAAKVLHQQKRAPIPPQYLRAF